MSRGLYDFLSGHGGGVKEGLHRRASEAPSPLMGPDLVVFAHPRIQIGLQLVDGRVDALSEGDAVELVQDGFVEALADAVGLRAFHLGPRVIDVLHRVEV